MFVDDILLNAMTTSDLKWVVDAFNSRFKITDSVEVNVYLSIHVERDWARRTMSLGQTDYINQMWRIISGQENLRIKTPFAEGWIFFLKVDNFLIY